MVLYAWPCEDRDAVPFKIRVDCQRCVECVSRNALESQIAHIIWSDFYGGCFRNSCCSWRSDSSWHSVGWCACWASGGSDYLLPPVFSKLQLPLLRRLSDDGFNADDECGPKLLSVAVSDELLSATDMVGPNAVVPTDLNVPILLDPVRVD